jgi:hypothetical protein
MPVGDLFKLRVYTRCRGAMALNVLHYKMTLDVGGPITQFKIASQWYTQCGAQFLDCVSQEAKLEKVTAQQWSELGNTPIRLEEGVVYTNVLGNLAGTALPSQVTGLIKLQSNSPGRSYRGRTYVPFPPETVNDAGAVPEANYMNLLAFYADKLDDSLNPVQVLPDPPGNATLAPVVYSSKLRLTSFINRAVPRFHWATQRKRRPGVGQD